MGIDVYLYWDGMTSEEEDAQITGFNIYSGHKGYLREAYHGGPYATKALVTEDWKDQPYDEDDELKSGFIIPNKVLQARKGVVMETAKERNMSVYGCDEDEAKSIAQSFADFIELHGEKERAGLNPRIRISY